jgi:hypothetical protein
MVGSPRRYDHGYDAEVYDLGLGLDPPTSRDLWRGAWRGSGRMILMPSC